MKTKPIAQMLLAMLCLASTPVLAREGSESSGGGGGGICLTPQNCKTLAETGFRITNPAIPDFELDQETLVELESIRGALPKWLQNFYTRGKVIGAKDTIHPISIENPQKVDVFLDEYKKIIRKEDPSFNFDRFSLLAFSVGEKTYIITDKFKAMQPRSRALLLIHEKNIRTHKTRVSDAIKLDGFFLDYIEAVRGNRLDSFDFWSFYRTLGEASIIDTTWSRSMMLGHLVLEDGMPLEELIKRSNTNDYIITPRYNEVLDLRNYHPMIAKDLGDERIRYESLSRNLTVADVNIFKLAIESFTRSTESRGRNQTLSTTYSVSVTANQLNEKIQESLKKFSNPELIADSLGACGNSSDTSKKYKALKNKEDYPYILRVDCSAGGENAFYDYRNQIGIKAWNTIGPSLQGLRFNFPGRLQCSGKKDGYDSAKSFYNCKLVK